MNKAKSGDTVRVHYKGTLDDGSVFDSSEGQDPIEFTLGSGQIIPGFEEAVLGMEPGQNKKARIPSAEAYGEHLDERMFDVNRSQLPHGMNAEVGQWLHGSLEGGESVSLMVAEVKGATVTLDANHPLAGKDLTFDITLVEVVTSG